MRSSLLLVLLAAAACLAHAGAESTAPARRRSLTVDLSPTAPRSDLDWCLESLWTLGLWCKKDILAGRPVPRACCRSVDEALHHCGPLTRAFLGSLFPRGALARCANPVITGPPATRPGARAPPRSSVRIPPPEAPSGTPKRSSVRIPPPEAPSKTQGSPGPKPQTTTRAPALSGGGARDGSSPEPKVAAGGSAGGLARRAPDAYGAAAGAPVEAGAAPSPQKGARTARPSAKVLPVG